MPHLGDCNRARPGEVGTRHRFAIADDIIQSARDDDFTAMHPRARADINDVVSTADCVLVVLDHQNCIAQVTKVYQGSQEPLVIALV